MASNKLYNPIMLFRFQSYFPLIKIVIFHLKVTEKSWLQMICFEFCVSVDEGKNLQRIYDSFLTESEVEISALNTDLNRLAGNDISVLN